VELSSRGNPVRALRSGDPAVVRLDISVQEPIPELTAGILFRDRLGNDVFGTNTFHCHAPQRDLVPGQRLSVEFAFESLSLGVGSFSLTTALHTRESHISANYDWWDRALVFQVVPGEGPIGIGVCRFPVEVAWTNSAALAEQPSTSQVLGAPNESHG